MKKLIVLVVLSGILGVVAMFGFVGSVHAQDDLPPSTPGPQSWFGRQGGMMNARSGGMQEYMEAALAEQLGLSVAELEDRHANGETFWVIADQLGFSQEEASQMMLDARSSALAKMVEEGTITQEQANLMKQRSGGGMMGGRGPGGCLGDGTPRGGGMRGRWSQDG